VRAAKTAEPIETSFGMWTWDTHWRNLANTIESSMCGGNAAFLWSPYVIGQTIIFSAL